jgi:ribonuclease Z
MSINFEILGHPGRDNALHIIIDSGHHIDSLLFDCGEGCLKDFGISQISSIDHIFFSHLHMDHVSGFDTFFRHNFQRYSKPNLIWGPPETARIMGNRFRGYWWNLIKRSKAKWIVKEIGKTTLKTFRFEHSEAFETSHDEGKISFSTQIVNNEFYSVEALTLFHGGPSIAYLVKESPKQNINVSLLKKLNFKPGPWLQQLKDFSISGIKIIIDNKEYDIDNLREKILLETKGKSIAYLTDFILDKNSYKLLIPWLTGCDTLVCEAQYKNEDLALARKNFHTTTKQVAKLAKLADIKKLILFHLSRRYGSDEWKSMLEEAQSIFPNTEFPPDWIL